jgi:pilus assembly protein CpaB
MSVRMLVLGLILLTAAGLGLVAWQLAQPPVQVAVAPAQAPVPAAPVSGKYLAAARAIPAGTLIRDEDFRSQDVALNAVPEGAITDTPDNRTQVRGALMRSYIDARTVVTSEMMLRPRDRGFLAAVLAPGTRAVSISVDPVSGVAGLIWPGDRVDLILVQESAVEGAPASQRIFSEIMLSDVRVIAIDQLIVQGASSADGTTGHLARVVTLQVSEEEAQRIAVGSRLGRLQLTIRAAEPLPAAATAESGVIFGRDVSPTLANASTVVVNRVRVIQGENVGEVTFK